MKKIFLLILLPVSLFFSCVGDRIASETMDRAEILLEANPDSAYILLNEVKTPDRLNERQFARWCMLYCRAADKLFKDMLYTEQLDRALVWYKSHGAAEQQAWMGLYLGRSYVKDKLFIPAMKAYSDALSLAKEKYLYDVAGISVAIWQTCTLIRAKEAKSGGSLKKRQNFLSRPVTSGVMPLPCEMWLKHGHLTILCRWRFTIC